MSRIPVLLVVAGLCIPAFAEVPERFLGTWVVDKEATARIIADDPNMSPENKPGWTKRWLEVEAEARITERAISFHGFDNRPMTASVVLEEDSKDRTLLSAVMTDPYRKTEMELSIAMHLSDNGNLNLKIRPDDDFDLVIWKRGEVGGADSSNGASGDAIGYLDSLKACEPGEFEFSYPGFGTYHNTIVGSSGDGCQVRIAHPQITMTCDYSEAMIALLTSEEKYEDARNGVLRGSTDSAESKLMSEECAVE